MTEAALEHHRLVEPSPDRVRVVGRM